MIKKPFGSLIKDPFELLIKEPFRNLIKAPFGHLIKTSFQPLIKAPLGPLIKARVRFLTAEKLFDCGKLTFLTPEKKDFKGYLHHKTSFCHNVALDV